MPNRPDIAPEPTHWSALCLEGLIRDQARTIRDFYACCLGLFLLGVLGTSLLVHYAVGSVVLKLGPVFISAAVNGVPYLYMSPARQRLSGLNQVKLLLEKPDLQAATKEELEKMVLGALKAVIGSTS